jgi:chemotaxis signal transduction protein
MDDAALGRRLSQLREAFDAMFASPALAIEEALQRFLAVGVGGAPYVFRLSEIGGIATHRRATPVPGPVSELLGLTGIRGRLVPVYSLAALIDAPSSTAPRWLVFVEREELAFAVENMDGCVFGKSHDVLPSGGNGAGHCQEMLRLENSSFGILSVPSILKRIKARVASTRPNQER